MFKQRIVKWLLGQELDKIAKALELYESIERIVKDRNSYTKKELNLKEVILLGNIADCNVSIKPQVHNRIVLSEVKLQAALRIMGEHQLISQNLFKVEEEKKEQLK